MSDDDPFKLWHWYWQMKNELIFGSKYKIQEESSDIKQDYLFYLLSKYNQNNNKWEIVIDSEPLPWVVVEHQFFLYDYHHDLVTSFRWEVENEIPSGIEALIEKMAKKRKSIHHSPINNKLWYPTDLLVSWQHWSDKQKDEFIKYIMNGNGKKK